MEGRIEIDAEVEIPLREIALSYARSSGPGGQNVNKTDSKAVLRFDIPHSSALPEGARERLLERLASRLTKAGELVLSCDQHREQTRNRESVLERFRKILADALKVEKVRRKTRTPGYVRAQRLADKRIRSGRKELRRKIDSSDDN